MSSEAPDGQHDVTRDSRSPPTISERKAHNAEPRIRRRNRLITSCLECRRRKLKCDKENPCANCTKIGRQCVFIASGLDTDAQARLAEVKEKMGILERRLEEDVARRGTGRSGSLSSSLPGQGEVYSDQEDDDDTKDLNVSQFVSEDAAYYEDEGNDDMADLGIALGKLRITERIGGLVRPRFSEELSSSLHKLPAIENYNIVPLSEQDPASWTAPSQDYVAPGSNFFFAPGVQKTSLSTHLPSKILVDKIIAHYWIAVHTIARTVHRPTFERQYSLFWTNINAGIEPRNSFQAVVFAMLLSSIISIPADRVLAEFGVDKKGLVDNFREGTEAALARANFLSTTKLETIQAFVMYLIPLCRNEVSRAHSALTGTLIRLAQCMGLHRDPTNYSSSPIEIHVRRLIWYQICFLDLRTCESTGPRPQIRPDDYDTKFPVNIDDIDLNRAEAGEYGIDVSTDRPHFTDMTITRIRFECYEMHRLLWVERPKTEKKTKDGERKVTLTALLSRVSSFKAAMEKTYVPMLKSNVPLHALASEIYGIISDRLYILLLQKYLSSDRKRMPEKLRQVIMGAAVKIIERSMTIEEHPALSTWSWYIGALHQYHVALLLLNEFYAGPHTPELEQRVWRCLDFAFGLPAEIPNLAKCRIVLEELIGKTSMLESMKRMRPPTEMPHARVYKDGYSFRPPEERGERERSTSQSTPSISDLPSPAPPPFQQLTKPRTTAARNFAGAIPEVNWGTIDMSAQTGQTLSAPVPFISTEGTNYADFSSSNPSGLGLMPVPNVAPVTPRRSSIDETPIAAIYGMKGTSTVGSSPNDPLNDIDWNDIEQMFGPADVAQGDIMIPPYTFPEFALTELQWNMPEGLL